MHSTYAYLMSRRWLQFSIRALLALTFVACCLAAWVAYKRDQAAQQQGLQNDRRQTGRDELRARISPLAVAPLDPG